MENNMILHNDKQGFEDAVRAASEHFQMRDTFVEKDYWVTFILNRLSQSKDRDKVVFKGGTSLSKVYKLIRRFSEDIDLAIIKDPEQSNHQIGKLIRSLQSDLTEGFSEVVTQNTTRHKNFRRSEYDYEHLFESGSSGQTGLNSNLVLEINSLADPVPNEKHLVRSIIAEFLEATKRTYAIDTYELHPFELNILVPQPTLIEKLLSIIRLSYFDDSIDRIRSKVRHFYDIYFLSNSKYCDEYIQTAEFLKDFERMYQEDKTKFSDPEKWINTHYKDSPALNSFDDIWNNVRSAYETDLRLLVYDDLPSQELVADKFRDLISILNK
ncbi:MAG TPA: nucleotidyl transferase AbiEii/AbiGii toxin family protein [Bacteroidales bacterium]|nr:nucleotidyl transferase AbiEii/AbiGii toxin family protein [Bacteroidales bacterium]